MVSIIKTLGSLHAKALRQIVSGTKPFISLFLRGLAGARRVAAAYRFRVDSSYRLEQRQEKVRRRILDFFSLVLSPSRVLPDGYSSHGDGRQRLAHLL